jgi:hypothetical protein
VPDPLVELLRAWRREICAVPIPVLVDPALAARVIREGARAHASPDDACTRAPN